MLKKIALKTVVALLAITIFATIAIPGETPIYAHNLPGCDLSRCGTETCLILMIVVCTEAWLDYAHVDNFGGCWW
ncbi:MAG: hypothetical protein PHU88_07080 [candidate division Zixibacteria bacterium]|nr:hypothetical protein [candidate division Zixibacteria bacterium]MDD5426177.1 hypothetical protein [candidate division Zixibacteria bacterium]